MTASASRTRWAQDLVRERCFTTQSSTLTFGAELELLAFDARDHSVLPIAGGAVCSGLVLARAVGDQLGWIESRSDKGVPRFASPNGGALTFEPGGQLEYASAVHHSLNGVLGELATVEAALRSEAADRRVELLAVGIDPYNDASAAPLQLSAPRYARMAEYFAGLGPAGARMMRQTASLQFNLGGVSVTDAWSAANALAPWLVAMFGNSRAYGGADSGFASYRAETWRHVDSRRTGLAHGGEPVADYAMFAFDAPAFLASDASLSFAALDDADVSEASLLLHLTTLFPEVRPRNYLEFRSIDAVDASRRQLALAMVTGCLADDLSRADLTELLGAPDARLLGPAGEIGLAHPRLGAAVDDIRAIALGGCARLGNTIVSSELVERLAAARFC